MAGTMQQDAELKRPTIVEEVDLFTPGAQEHWFEAYEVLHAHAPVLHIPGGGAIAGTDAFVITKYDDISRIVRDPDTFPTAADYNVNRQQAEIFRKQGFGQLVDARRTLRPTIEQHKQHRQQLTDPWVGAVGAERNGEMIIRHANTLLDRFIDDGEVELVKQFAALLPQMVITTILGFPLEDMQQLRVWEEAQVRRFVFGRTHRNLMSDEDEQENAEALVQFHRYIQKQIDEKWQNPQDDMITYLTKVQYGGRPLTDGEIMSVAVGMHIGGNETTQYALTAEALLLAQTPDLWAELKEDRSKVRLFVEEALRLQAPTQGLSTRIAGNDVKLHGVKIPKGSLLHLRYGAGNRDPEEFPHPNQIDLGRPHIGRHLTFSQGPRSCPGAGLTRLEQNIAVNVWLDRFERLELPPGKNDFKHQPGIMLGLYKLHLTFAKAR